MPGDQVSATIEDDILHRAYEAAVDKYHQMVGPDRLVDPTLVGQTATDGKASLGQQASATGTAQEQADTDLQQPATASTKRMYSKDEILDIAELSQATGNSDILPSLQLFGLLQDSISPQQTKPNHATSKASQLQADLRSSAPRPSVPDTHSGSQQASIHQSPQDMPMATQESQQQPAESQQYSQADWDAYWQYYGYSAAPPPPPPAPHLCLTHIKLLEQMLSASTEQSQAVPDAVPAAPAASTARDALQTRAEGIQGGALSDLLLAWFDAGYQTGKHEAQMQRQQQ